MIINYEKPFQKVEIFWELSIGNVFRTENTEGFFMKVGNDEVIRLKAELNVKDD